MGDADISSIGWQKEDANEDMGDSLFSTQLESFSALQNLEKEYDGNYGSNNAWEESINESLKETLTRMQTKEDNIKAQFEKILQIKEATVNYQKEVEEKERMFEEEKNKMRKINEIQESIVVLNVGGKHFTTSKTTLCRYPDSMLGAMFSGQHKLTKYEDGSYFIDADGTHFGIILNYLRGKVTDIHRLPKDKEVLLQLQTEVDFYQLPGLDEIIKIAIQNVQPTMQSWISEKFSYSNGKWATIKSLYLQNLNLDGISLAKVSFTFYVTFENSSLIGASFRGCTFMQNVAVDFTSADIRQCDFRDTYYPKVAVNSILKEHLLNFKDTKNIQEAYFADDVLKKLKERFNF